MDSFTHKVQYYETDQMGFVHHSNYIRWFEEARSDYFEKIGAPYTETEKRGIYSPVLSVNCCYHKSVRYGETVRVALTMKKFGNVRFVMTYQVSDADTGELRAEGESEHCFIDHNGKVLSLRHCWPELFEYLKKEAEKENGGE